MYFSIGIPQFFGPLLVYQKHSHINSTPRKNSGTKTPYEIFTFIYGEELANKLNIHKIAKDEITTTPRLLK